MSSRTATLHIPHEVAAAITRAQATTEVATGTRPTKADLITALLALADENPERLRELLATQEG